MTGNKLNAYLFTNEIRVNTLFAYKPPHVIQEFINNDTDKEAAIAAVIQQVEHVRLLQHSLSLRQECPCCHSTAAPGVMIYI